MIRPRFGNGRGPRRLALAAATLLFAAVFVPAQPVFAQTERNAPADAITPVEEFSRQIEQLKKTFTDLGKKIEDGTKSIDGLTDVERARKEIADLRAAVSALLGAVADNGDVARLGIKARERAEEKLKGFERDTRFKPAEKDFLIAQWRKLKDETERAMTELAGARKDFAELLRTLQTNEDFIDELVQIRQAQKAIEVIRQLTKDIRDASDQLKKLIGGIKPPGV
jgi:DNA repair exonuclease SbcCD ATPase subunit